MPLFEYKGVDPKGKAAKGTVDAESGKAARQKLKSRGIYTTEIKERAAEKGGNKNSVLQLLFLTQS